MAFAQSVHNQSPVLRIHVLVVDDDPVFLQVMSRMLEKSKYREPSTLEVTVIAARDSIEALYVLKVQRDNIDLIITDYYMPGMNGIQLKKQITKEFGNLPVIVMSSDATIEKESLTCGALCFLPKPIKASDLTKVYHFAVTYKRNNKSILWTEHNTKGTDVSVPKQIQLLPEQANVQKNKMKCASDSRSVNSPNDSCVSTGGSRQNLKRKITGDLSEPSKKRKVTWTDGLHDLFLQAIKHIGLDKAVPKKILAYMNVSYLTRENIASHLQKYRIFLKKVADQGLKLELPATESMFMHGHIREPSYNNYYTPSTSLYDTSVNNRSFYSKPAGLGLGQSRLLSNRREPVRFNQMPYTYMNRSSTYESQSIGSGPNVTLPIQSNLSFSNQPSLNEGRRSFFEPPMITNTIGQTSQIPAGFEQYASSAISGMMSSYGSFTPNQPEPSHFSSGMQSFLNNENTSPYNPQPHTNAATQPDLELPDLGNLSLYDNHADNTNELSYIMSNVHLAHNKQPQGEAVSTNFGLPANFPTEQNLIVPVQDDGDWTFVNPNQDDLGKTNELSYIMNNFQFDHNNVNQPQGEADSTNFGLPANFPTEPNQNFPVQDDADWTFVNANQGHFNGESSNVNLPAPETNSAIFNMNPNNNQGHFNGETPNSNLPAPETNETIFNMNPNINQEEDDVPDFDWSSFLNPQQDLAVEDYINSPEWNSLFNDGMD